MKRNDRFIAVSTVCCFQNQIAKREGEDVITLKLTLAQLYLGQGHVYQACDMMRALGACTYMPGMVRRICFFHTWIDILSKQKLGGIVHIEAAFIQADGLTMLHKNGFNMLQMGRNKYNIYTGYPFTIKSRQYLIN